MAFKLLTHFNADTLSPSSSLSLFGISSFEIVLDLRDSSSLKYSLKPALKSIFNVAYPSFCLVHKTVRSS